MSNFICVKIILIVSLQLKLLQLLSPQFNTTKTVIILSQSFATANTVQDHPCSLTVVATFAGASVPLNLIKRIG